MSHSSVIVNIRQEGHWRSPSQISLNGAKYGRGLEKDRWVPCLQIEATSGELIDLSGGPIGTYWEQFLGRSRHSIQVDGQEIAHIESRGTLGLQSWLVIGSDSFRLSHEFSGSNRRLIRDVKPTRWNSRRPCDFEFFEGVPVAIAVAVSYWLWLIYVNPAHD